MSLLENGSPPYAPLPVFTPNTEKVVRSQLTSFMHYCETCTGRTFGSYAQFDQFSVEGVPHVLASICVLGRSSSPG